MRLQYTQLNELHFQPPLQMAVADVMEILDSDSGKAVQSELTWFGDRELSPSAPHHIMAGASEAAVRLEDGSRNDKA